MRYQNKKEVTEDKRKSKRHEKKKPHLAWFLTLIILVGLFYGYMVIERRVQSYETTIDELSSEIKDLKRNNKLLEEQMENVNSDEYIERIARERLGMVKDGEVILKQSDDKIEDEEETEASTEKKKDSSASTEKKKDSSASTEKKKESSVSTEKKKESSASTEKKKESSDGKQKKK